MARIKHYNPETRQWEYSDISSAINNNKEVISTGNIIVTVANNIKYSYTDVTSLTMNSSIANCYGFVTFASSTPTITVTGFDASSGDDITSAAASETWEFSVDNHAGKSYIIWKNWGV